MKRALAGIAVLLATTTFALGCGKERWPVKVGMDQDAANVSLFPIETTIAELGNIAALHNPDAQKRARYPTELNTYTVHGILTVIKHESDEDYHLVIAEPDDREITMIVESPALDCAQGSPFENRIDIVRQEIADQLGAITRKRHPNIPVTVTGVAFFDKLHGQEGVAPNGIELHPILNISFH